MCKIENQIRSFLKHTYNIQIYDAKHKKNTLVESCGSITGSVYIILVLTTLGSAAMKFKR